MGQLRAALLGAHKKSFQARKTQHDRGRSSVDLQPGDLVLISNEVLQPGAPKSIRLWSGPFQVTRKCGRNTVRVITITDIGVREKT